MKFLTVIRRFFYLTPRDVGMQIYSVEDIAKRMVRDESIGPSESLVEFGKTVNWLMS